MRHNHNKPCGNKRYYRHVVLQYHTLSMSFKFMVIWQTKKTNTNNCKLSIKIFLVEHTAVKARQITTRKAFCHHYDKGKE